MEWKLITTLNPHDRCSADIKKLAKLTNRKAAKLQEEWAELQADRLRAAAGSTAELFADGFTAGVEMQCREVRLIEERADIHAAYLELGVEYQRSLLEAAAAVNQEWEVAKQLTIEWLEKGPEGLAGFRPFQNGQPDPGIWKPGYAFELPGVRDLHNLESELRSQAHSRSFAQRHQADLGACQEWLEAARKRAQQLIIGG